LPRSTAFEMSNNTRYTAVSTEWPGRNPDYKDGRSDDDKYQISRRTTRRSLSLDNTDRFEIGRYELTFVLSSPSFFNTGVMNAALNTTGKWPAEKRPMYQIKSNQTLFSKFNFTNNHTKKMAGCQNGQYPNKAGHLPTER